MSNYLKAMEDHYHDLDMKYIEGVDDEIIECKYCLDRIEECECTREDIQQLLGYVPEEWHEK